MPEHQYLSIGEVLALLLEEFPDVTISKIRFLESQGLIDPERTPSGYRKFYDGDVDRLRVILREQRENFLPLRVIRDRLESGEIDESGALTPPRGLRNVTVLERPSYDGGFDETGELDIPPGTPVPTAHHPAAQLRVTPTVSPAAAPSIAAVPSMVVTPAPSTPNVAPALNGPVSLNGPATPNGPGTANGPAGHHGPSSLNGPATLNGQAASYLTAVPPVASAPPPSAPERPVNPAAAFFASNTPVDDDPVRDSYVASELCALAGITSKQLAELESYSLLSGKGTGTSTLYSHADLSIARAAAGFLERGVEPRHLRGWRQSAEREAALFEQMVLPLIRQRNPQSRQQAAALLTELSRQGAELRAAILNSALAHHLEP